MRASSSDPYNSVLPSALPAPAPEEDRSRALERDLSWHAASVTLGGCGAAAASWTGALALPAAVTFGVLWLRGSRGYARRGAGLGLANALTAIRLGILFAALWGIPALPARWILVAFSLNVVLDVLDGLAARSLGQATALGAMLDREADAFFVLVAYLHFHMAGVHGSWLLLPGLMPYLSRLVTVLSGVRRPVDHKDRLARPLAGANFLLLLAAAALPGAAPALLVVSTTVVLSSFALSLPSLRFHADPLP